MSDQQIPNIHNSRIKKAHESLKGSFGNFEGIAALETGCVSVLIFSCEVEQGRQVSDLRT